jgi:hypothetical protein
VVGDASLDFGELLIDAEARIVHVYDSRGPAARGRPVPRGVTVRELPRDGFDVRDGAFDLAIVPDLAALPGGAAAAPTLLSRLRRLLAADGALLVAAKNPAVAPEGGIEYGDLFDMVSLQFEHVRMIGQVPFTGAALAELGEPNDEPEVSVDMQLGPEDKTPHAFVALASQRDVRLAPYALVELSPSAPPPPSDDAALRATLAEATLKADLLAAQLDQVRSATHRNLTEADAELAAHRTRVKDLEDQAADYKRMFALAEVEVTASRAGLAELEERIAALEAELDAVRAAADVPQVDPAAVALLAERAERGERAKAVVERLEADLASMGEHHAAELHRVEALLLDRARALKELEAELGRRERLVKELVRALEDAQHVPAQGDAHPHDGDRAAEVLRENESLRARLDTLAMQAARREADAQTQSWRVAELEEKLAMRASAPVPSPGPAVEESLVAQARSEIDALRQALAQEHEARTRLESGEALAKAQADLARQAVLIEQLSRELDARDRTRQAEQLRDSPT